MKEIKTIYSCDCCKKEVSSEEDLIIVKLPYQVAVNTTGSFISWEMIDEYKTAIAFEICQDCAKKIVDGYRKYIDVTDLPYKGWSIELIEE